MLILNKKKVFQKLCYCKTLLKFKKEF